MANVPVYQRGFLWIDPIRVLRTNLTRVSHNWIAVTRAREHAPTQRSISTQNAANCHADVWSILVLIVLVEGSVQRSTTHVSGHVLGAFHFPQRLSVLTLTGVGDALIAHHVLLHVDL